MSGRVDRREFFRRSLFAAAALPGVRLGASSGERIARDGQPRRVVVIGAGLSGLVAAYELVRAGHDVRVLEAQSRVGGRVLTLRSPFAEGLWADAGAARLHDSHDWTMRYVRELELPLLPFYPEDARFVDVRDREGKVVKWDRFRDAVRGRVGVELGTPRGWHKIAGGNDRLPAAFASRLGERIVSGARVVRIEHDANRARVTFHRAGSAETLEAERVVCAVPFTLLRAIEVSPAFSPEKRAAIERLPYDPASRVFVQTRTRFWEGRLNGFAITDDPAEVWPASFGLPGTRGVLQVYTRGYLAAKVTAAAEPARVADALHLLERALPGARAAYEAGASKCWSEDAWARGAWAHPPPAMARAIAQPEGRIHFAGEHASAWPSWMQGAIESGFRAAREANEAG